MNIKETLQKNKIVPVAVFSSVNEALETAELLVKHSINILEITARTEAAFDCIKEVSSGFPDLVVGAGSILDIPSLEKAVECGAAFGVSPAFDEKILDRSSNLNLPFVPGIATPTELIKAISICSVVKIFPASSLGGIPYIKSVIAPFKMQDFSIMPTGGINNKNYLEYLAVDKIICCGMSYIVDSGLISKGSFDILEERIIEVLSGLKQSTIS